MMSRWKTLVRRFLRSSVGAYFLSDDVALDMLIEQVGECRQMLDRHAKNIDVPPATIAIWRTRIEQAEWELVRCLEKKGRADDPFVLWKKGIGGKPQ
ncbi:MAG: hypothetical protein EB084_15655 [Proteobacteria bacterium]|nr:hypothetical protein [Pseudomonadota bacterium]